ncbi:uncharacterized protein LOC117032971 [Rhinolophus ferrumequinum]|uniref:uncharacterized protein LOC117032971 n=1 Tax=Rhinolophus ferrumequinum TaxID=59479 RepID=UPI00140F9A33|nr:uncharacterized protein LOC117032971 [Rhinolophus ferrumequinum]
MVTDPAIPNALPLAQQGGLWHASGPPSPGPDCSPRPFLPANHRGKYAAPKDHRLTGQLPEEQTRPWTQAQPCTQARGGRRSTGAEAERPASEPCTIDSRGKSTESRETVNGLYPRELGTGLFKSEAVARSSQRLDWAPTCRLAPLPSLPPALAHHRLSIAAHAQGPQSLGGDREREVNVTRPSTACHPSVRGTLEFPVGGQQRCAGQVPRAPQDLPPDCYGAQSMRPKLHKAAGLLPPCPGSIGQFPKPRRISKQCDPHAREASPG